jgi:hypothetical protein
VLTQVESAEIFAAPEGCAASHADSHVSSVHAPAQSRSAVQSASVKHAFASAQQLPSRHALHVGSGLPNPHALVGGGPDGPPHASEQLDETHEERVSRSDAPFGCAAKHEEKQASSVHALPHAMSAAQSESEAHAVS